MYRGREGKAVRNRFRVMLNFGDLLSSYRLLPHSSPYAQDRGSAPASRGEEAEEEEEGRMYTFGNDVQIACSHRRR